MSKSHLTSWSMYITLVFLTLSITTQAKKNNKDEFFAEGHKLFRLEKAAWYGSDYLTTNHPYLLKKIGGYITYINEDQTVTHIFYGDQDSSEVLLTTRFDSIAGPHPLEVDSVHRDALPRELRLIQARSIAVRRFFNNPKKFYSFYRGTSNNFVVLEGEKGKIRVYILTASKSNEYLLIGNDYCLHFNRKIKLKKEERFHKSLLKFPFRSDDPENEISQTMHNHKVGDLISPTDICTLLLYKNHLSWSLHTVYGKNHVSIFNLNTENLLILKKKAWKRIGRDIEERGLEK